MQLNIRRGQLVRGYRETGVPCSVCSVCLLWACVGHNYLLGKGGYVFCSIGLSVCLFVCTSVCLWTLLKSYARIGMKFYGGVLDSTMKNWLNFRGDLSILRWVNEQNNTIIVVAYPDRGASNDPKHFFFGGGVVFHHHGSTFLQWVIWE